MIETVAVSVVALLVVGWLVLSVIAQFDPRWFRPARNADRFHVLPNWRFFAPNPVSLDTHFLIRDRAADGTLSRWTAFDGVFAWRAHHPIWHPHRRVQTSIFALLNNLVEDCRATDDIETVACISGAYTALLALSVAVHPPSGAVERQFALVSSVGFGEARAVQTNFISLFHPVGEPHNEINAA